MEMGTEIIPPTVGKATKTKEQGQTVFLSRELARENELYGADVWESLLAK